MTTAFEDLPIAAKTESVRHDDCFDYKAEFLVERGYAGGTELVEVHTTVHKDKVSELRLKVVRHEGRITGKLVDADGVIFGATSAYAGESASVTGADDEAFVAELTQQLVLLIATWRERARYADTGPHLACAAELEAVLRSAT